MSDENSNRAATEILPRLSTIKELREFSPIRDGQLVYVEEYDTDYTTGGGMFRYVKNGRLMEDYGYSIIGRNNAHWVRQLNSTDELNVCHFGARNDGSVDCVNAVRNMQRWSWNGFGDEKRVIIRFPAGRFLMSTLDITGLYEIRHFSLTGAPATLGYNSPTVILSELKAGVTFRVNARYSEITNLSFDGRNAEKNDASGTEPNTRGFFENLKKEGQYFRGECLWFTRMGGTGISLIDTLDTSITHWYASNCEGTIIYGRWSNIKSWDHITAIQLTNFNVQNCSKRPVIDLPRCTQSFIYNGWIEHTEFPGDLREGQWIIDGLSLEDCKNKMDFRSARLVITQLNLQSGSSIDTDEILELSERAWLSEFEGGSVRIENFGATIDGTLSVNAVTSQHRIDNNRQDPQWFHLGQVYAPTRGDVIRIKILASAGYNTIKETQQKHTTSTGQGMAEIFLQKNSGDMLQGSWFGAGSSPVQAVQITSDKSGRGDIYIQLRSWTTNAVALVETNAKDHFILGVSFRFIKAFIPLSDDAFNKIANKIVCFEQYWLGNEKVGIGYNANNQLLLSSAVVNTSNYATTTQGVTVWINGNEYLLPLLKKK